MNADRLRKYLFNYLLGFSDIPYSAKNAAGCAQQLLVSAIIFVGCAKKSVGCAKFFVGSARLFVGSAQLFVGSAQFFVGSAQLFVGSARLFVGFARLFVGSAQLFVGSARNFVGSALLLFCMDFNVTAFTLRPEFITVQRAIPQGLKHS